jgi:hypothetical protein
MNLHGKTPRDDIDNASDNATNSVVAWRETAFAEDHLQLIQQVDQLRSAAAMPSWLYGLPKWG